MYVFKANAENASEPVPLVTAQKYWPARTESQSKMCCAWSVVMDDKMVGFAAARMIRLEMALKVGKMRKVAETIIPQLPAPPPRNT
jgi:hypothetical protein